MENLSEKFIRIIVNGRTKPFNKKAKSISYEAVIVLAFGSYEEHPNRIFTVNFFKGKNDSKGSICKGDSVKVAEGMIFNVTATDMA